MDVDELRTQLRQAVDLEPAADRIDGRRRTDRRVRHHQRRQITAVAMFVTVMLVGFTVAFSRVGSDERPNDTLTNGDEVPKLVPRYLPDGMGIVDGGTRPNYDWAGSIQTTIFVRAEPGQDITDEMLLGDSFAVTTGADSHRLWRATASPSDRARENVQLYRSADGLQAVMPVLEGDPRQDPRVFFAVLSRTKSEAELRELLATITASDGLTVDLSTVPPGYRAAVTKWSSPYALGFAYPNDLVADGYTMMFGDGPLPTKDLGWFQLTVQRGSDDDLRATSWFTNQPIRRSVRGHAAIAGSISSVATPEAASTPASLTTVGWLEHDGAWVTLDSASLSTDELVRIAEKLESDPIGWEHLKEDAIARSRASCDTRPNWGRYCAPTGTVGTGVTGTSTRATTAR